MYYQGLGCTTAFALTIGLASVAAHADVLTAPIVRAEDLQLDSEGWLDTSTLRVGRETGARLGNAQVTVRLTLLQGSSK
ncbi:hypothetical protein [Burkholderia ubonensis]|uniref:hypothetical protein n=1 Tax=Burkholderia ubonensis TaxID=101571 RepID=UPI00075928F9|nr:hypothetical protein [Burkholderia ubonensis]KVV07379.1 hypothetical protein WK77_16455 [Burkholderia ubonensis]